MDGACDSSVDQTIQWARASLQRRRDGLLNQKKSLIESYSKKEESPPKSPSSTDVYSMIETGRALLAEAGAHSEILGRYVSKDQSNDPFDERGFSSFPPRIRHPVRSELNQQWNEGEFMSRFLQETSLTEDKLLENDGDGSNGNSLIAIPREKPVWGEVSMRSGGDFNPGNFNLDGTIDTSHRESGDLAVLLREGEARARLDKLIATVRLQGDDPSKLLHSEHTTTSNQISSFDPSEMKAAKRAALKEVKRAEAAAAAEEESRLLTSFKALPLPGGVQVKNDLFATTRSFQGKRIGTVERLVRQDTKCVQLNDITSSMSGTFGGLDCDGMSVVTSQTSVENASSCRGIENDVDKERAKQVRAEKALKKRQLLSSINNEISKDFEDMNALPHHDDEFEDASKLHQQISILEAKLKRKRTQRSATLNDIVDIDMDALFGTLLQGEVADGAKQIVGRLKERVCAKYNLEESAAQTIQLEANRGNENSRQDKESSGDLTDRSPGKSLFRRHEEWVKERERKRSDVRLRLDEEELNSMTGTPGVADAKLSWKKAKDAHDQILRKSIEEEERKHNERKEKERIANELKMKEIKELQKQADTKLQTMRSDVNREEQLKRLEKLSQPRKKKEDLNILQRDDVLAICEQQTQLTPKSNFLPTKHTKKIYEETRLDSIKKDSKLQITAPHSSKSNTKFSGKSFSEMNDKEFAKLLKKISKAAASKKAIDTQQSQPPDGDDSMVEVVSNPENIAEASTPIFSEENDVGSSQLIESGNKWSSGIAQANLFRKATSTEMFVTRGKSSLQKVQIMAKEEPFVFFERGEIPFFDIESSTDEIGRFRIREARGFLADTLCKIPLSRAREKGITLLVGKKEYDGDELAVSILFDLSTFNETRAEEWWIDNRERFVGS